MTTDPGPEVRRALAAWLGSITPARLDAERLELRSPSGGGWSNDTWIVAEAPGLRPCAVVRLQPQRRSMFPDYDLSRQSDVLAALAPTPVAAPALLGTSLDGVALGRPAFAMAYVEGRAPSDDRPGFAEAGWLFDATPAEQGRFHRSLIEQLATVHALDADAVGLGRLRPAGGDSHAAALDDLRRIWVFDPGPLRSPVLDEAFALVAATVPRTGRSPDTLLWGDARPANVLCPHDDFVVTALLDWELATVGPPEFDVAWLLEMNWMRVEGAGCTPLPGFLGEHDTVRYYGEVAGRPLGELRWYRLFAGLKVAVFLHRYLRAVVHAGRLPEGHRSFGSNVATERLAALLASA